MIENSVNDEMLYPWSTPRQINYFKVYGIVRNKLTDEVNRTTFYICCKKSEKWLSQNLSFRMSVPLPVEYFEFTWELEPTQDSDRINFHYITTRQEWERISYQYVCLSVISHHWKIDYIKKFTNLVKKIVTFITNRIFINRTIIKV